MTNFRDLDAFTLDEELLASRPLDEVLRRAAAQAHVLADEEAAAVSTRPTSPVFHGRPWS